MLSLSFTPFPELSTSRLQLRRMVNEDANELFGLRSHPEVMRHIGRPLAKSIDDAYRLIGQIDELVSVGNGINWAICLKEDQKLIGTICFWKILKEHYRAEIGYLLHPDHQHLGIMQEALDAVLRFGFEEMKLHSVEANISPDNIASLKLVGRARFVKEAYFRESFYWEGKFTDTSIWSLITPLKGALT